MEKLAIEKSSLFSDSNTGLNLELTGVNLNISADISISSGSSRNWWIFKQITLISGSIAIGTTGLRLHLAMLVKRDDDGQPLFNVTNCSFYAGDYDIEFGGQLGYAHYHSNIEFSTNKIISYRSSTHFHSYTHIYLR